MNGDAQAIWIHSNNSELIGIRPETSESPRRHSKVMCRDYHSTISHWNRITIHSHAEGTWRRQPYMNRLQSELSYANILQSELGHSNANRQCAQTKETSQCAAYWFEPDQRRTTLSNQFDRWTSAWNEVIRERFKHASSCNYYLP